MGTLDTVQRAVQTNSVHRRATTQKWVTVHLQTQQAPLGPLNLNHLALNPLVRRLSFPTLTREAEVRRPGCVWRTQVATGRTTESHWGALNGLLSSQIHHGVHCLYWRLMLFTPSLISMINCSPYSPMGKARCLLSLN